MTQGTFTRITAALFTVLLVVGAVAAPISAVSNNQDTTRVMVEDERADLNVEKEVNATSVEPGDGIKFDMVVVNNGSGEATDVRLTESIPDCLDYVDDSPTKGVYDQSTEVWAIGSLLASESAHLEIVLRVTERCEPGDLANTVEVSSEMVDPEPDDNVAEATVTVGEGEQHWFDFGDAPDPEYPTNASSNGSRHTAPQRAWLGDDVTSETSPRLLNQDDFDDGFNTNQSTPKKLSVDVTNHNASVSTFYVNMLVDVNSDGDWQDADEWAVRNHTVTVSPGNTKTTSFLVSDDIISDFNNESSESYTRLTLTAEPLTNYTGHGEYELGETEDYSHEEMSTVGDLSGGFGGSGPVVDLDATIAPVFPGGDGSFGGIVIGNISIGFGGDGFGGDFGSGDGLDRPPETGTGQQFVAIQADAESDEYEIYHDVDAMPTAISDVQVSDDGTLRLRGVNDRKTVQPRDLIVVTDEDASGPAIVIPDTVQENPQRGTMKRAITDGDIPDSIYTELWDHENDSALHRVDHSHYYEDSYGPIAVDKTEIPNSVYKEIWDHESDSDLHRVDHSHYYEDSYGPGVAVERTEIPDLVYKEIWDHESDSDLHRVDHSHYYEDSYGPGIAVDKAEISEPIYKEIWDHESDSDLHRVDHSHYYEDSYGPGVAVDQASIPANVSPRSDAETVQHIRFCRSLACDTATSIETKEGVDVQPLTDRVVSIEVNEAPTWWSGDNALIPKWQYDQLRKLYELSEEADGSIDALAGDGTKTVLLETNWDPPALYTAITVRDGRITEMQPLTEEEADHLDASVRIHADRWTMHGILVADDSRTAAERAIARGDLEIHNGPETSAASALIRIRSKFTETRFEVDSGEEKEIQWRGDSVTLRGSPLGYGVIDRGSNAIGIVVGSDGVERGFTTETTQRLIEADPEGLSSNAGVYDPATVARTQRLHRAQFAANGNASTPSDTSGQEDETFGMYVPSEDDDGIPTIDWSRLRSLQSQHAIGGQDRPR